MKYSSNKSFNNKSLYLKFENVYGENTLWHGYLDIDPLSYPQRGDDLSQHHNMTEQKAIKDLYDNCPSIF